MANSDAFYKVVLNGRYAGQAIVNVLYYRLADEYVPGPLNFAGAEDLAFQVKQEIWTPSLKGTLSDGYVLENITVYPMDAGFSLLYQMPYQMPVNESGSDTGVATNGPATCAIIRFNLEPTSPLNGIYPPRSGYVAIGPLSDAYVDNTGHIPTAALAGWQGVADALSQNLENAVPPAVFYPIRVKQTKVLGVLKIISYADISGASTRSLASFRRSRQPEQ
jgi:hypothetical protein